MKILFLRESEGVYQFGQKRVYIKIEKGNQIKVRVGGGFMHIDDFIEQYTPTEIEKIERRGDVIGRFGNKLTMQKISSVQSIRAVETSPIRSPQRPRSPPNPKFRVARSPVAARLSPKGSPGRRRRALQK